MIYKFICRLLSGASAEQTDAVLRAAVKRRQELYPDWDVAYVALPKNDTKRRSEMLREMLKFEENNR